MGILKALSKVRGGYPGGWREYARGYQGSKTPPFVQPSNADDRRSLIPALGLREYWQPALPAKDIGWKKPVGLKISGVDLTLFRDKNGEVQALWDYCPHRGVYLSWGDCFWKGYLSCPYHGATFDGDGECVEFITEGPDSKMVGQLKARKFPTRTLKGMVFIWMGEGEPAPIEEDIPPEFFEDSNTLVFATTRYWDCNWMVALENSYDSHVGFWVHRNSLRGLRGRTGIGARTPIGARPKIIKNRVVAPQRTGANYYATDGKQPYQLYHPRIGAYWPKYKWRLLWIWLTEKVDGRIQKRPRMEFPEEWDAGHHLPGIVRNNHWNHMYTRWVVPVEDAMSRVWYFHTARPKNALARLYERVQYHLFHNFQHNFNFSDQDYDAMRSTRWQYPEYLSSTDLCTAAFRRLITEHARGITRTIEVDVTTTAEQLVADGDRRVGMEPDQRLLTGFKDEEQVTASG